MIDDRWHGNPAVDEWGPEQRLVYYSLQLDPSASLCGCWRLAIGDLAERTRLSRQKLLAVLPALEPLAGWDPEARLVYLRLYMGEQARVPKVLMSAARDLARLIAEYHGPLSDSLSVAYRYAMDRLSKPSVPVPVPASDPDRRSDPADAPAQEKSETTSSPSGPEGFSLAAPGVPKPKTPRKANPIWEAAKRVAESHLIKARLPGKPSRAEIVLIVRAMSDGGLSEDLCMKAIDGFLASEWHRAKGITAIKNCFASVELTRRFIAETRGVWERGEWEGTQ